MDTLLTRLAELLLAGVDFVPKLITSVVVFLAALVMAKLAGRAVLRAMPKADEAIKRLLNRLTTMGIIIVGIVVALQHVDLDVSAFVAGLGLVGFTLGFAFQDSVKNFMARILLLIQQPFGIGDAIEVSGCQGKVTDVDIRATTMKGWDGQEVVVPNAEVYTSPIRNYSRYDARRIVLSLGLGYEEDIAKTQDVFLKAIGDIEDILEEAAPAVYCTSLGSSALELGTYFWIDQTQSNMLAVTSEAVQALKEAAAREGINLPYPIQTIRLRQLAEKEPL